MSDQLPAKLGDIATNALAKYDEKKYNRLLPSTTLLENLGQFQKVSVEEVQIDSDVNGVDVYQERRVNKPALTKVALDKIAHAGGLTMHPTASGVDEHVRGQYIRYKAVGLIKKADGTPLVISRMKEIDMETEEEEIRLSYEKKSGSPDQKEANIRRDLLQIRKNMLPNAETKAWNRVVRACFAIPSSFKAQDLKKPFVVVRFDTAFDMTDPTVQRALIDRAAASMGALFQDVTGALSLPEPTAVEGKVVATSTPEEPGPADPAEEPDPLDAPPDEGPSEEEKYRIERLDALGGRTPEELRQNIADLCGAAEYDTKADPDGIVADWTLTNAMEEEAQIRERAQIIEGFEGKHGFRSLKEGGVENENSS
jgi:hypothetical protein